MEDRNDINQFRRKTLRRKFFTKLALVVLAALIIILAAANWEKIISPFKDAALDVGKAGFPVALPGSAGYVLGELGDNFCLLTDTYFYTYNSEGSAIAGFQHGFQTPVSDANDKRALVYDKNGKGFRFYSKSAEIYSNNVEDSIVFAEIGSEERCAVITTSSRYANYLYVFNAEGKQIFRWASPDGKILRVCFSDDDKSLYAAVIGERGGELRLSVARFDLDNAENAVWQTQTGSDLICSLEYCPDGIYAVTEGGNLLLDKDSGEVLAEGSFSKPVYGIPEADGARFVIFKDSGSNGETVVSYNAALEAEGSLSSDGIVASDAAGGRLYILSGTELSVYNELLESVNKYELDDVYSDVRIIGGSAYLLGYNTVQRLSL